MSHRISTIVGYSSMADDVRRPVFRALSRQTCSVCTAEIAVGNLFTRRARFGRGMRSLVPRCRSCAPFVVSSSTDAKNGVGESSRHNFGCERTRLKNDAVSSQE